MIRAYAIVESRKCITVTLAETPEEAIREVLRHPDPIDPIQETDLVAEELTSLIPIEVGGWYPARTESGIEARVKYSWRGETPIVIGVGQ